MSKPHCFRTRPATDHERRTEISAGLFLVLLIPVLIHAAELTPEQVSIIARIDSLHATSQPDLVHAEIAQLLAQARAEADSSFELALLVRDGAEWVAFGQPRNGEPILTAALPLAEALADSLHLCSALRWLAVTKGILGDNEAAETYSTRLLATSLAIESGHYEGWARVGLAWHARLAGRRDEAITSYRLAEAAFDAAADLQGKIWVRNSLGTMYEKEGAYAEAYEYYAGTVSVGRENGWSFVEARALNNLGVVEFARGDPARAMELFQRARDLHLETQGLSAAIVPANNVACCQSMLGRYTEAAAGLQENLDRCRERELPILEAKVLNHLAGVKRQQGLIHEATTLYRLLVAGLQGMEQKSWFEGLIGLSNSLADQDSCVAGLAVLQADNLLFEPPTTGLAQVQWLFTLGKRHAEVGNLDQALLHLRQANTAAIRMEVVDFRVPILAESARVYRRLAAPDSAVARLAEASTVWETERGISLDPEWREQRGKTGRMLYSALADLLLEPGADRPVDRCVQETFDRLQPFKARTLLDRMLGPGAKLAEAIKETADTIVTLDQLQQSVLQAGELFLDAYLGPDISLIMAVTPTTARAVRLPPLDELEERLQACHEILGAPPLAGQHTSGTGGRQLATRKLAELLLAEVLDLIHSADRIFVSPDGALNLVPFATLSGSLDDESLTTPDDRRQVWMRVPSATILQRLRRTPDADSDQFVPELIADQHPPSTVLAITGSQGESGQILRGAQAEIRDLERRYRGVDTLMLPADRSSPDQPDLTGYDVLHLASHVNLDEQHPWRSRILLSSDDTGDLQADAIATMQLDGKLTVLSSCASGVGQIVSGEGVLGLSSAFLSAGIPAVVATLWPVDDRATRQLMRHFYAALADHRTVAEALALAQQVLHDTPATSHPFFWSGFVVIGDGNTRLFLEPRWRPSPVLLAAVLITVLGVLTGLILWRRATHRSG